MGYLYLLISKCFKMLFHRLRRCWTRTKQCSKGLNTKFISTYNSTKTHFHSNAYVKDTHTRLTALCPGLPRWTGTRKVKPIWILLKQETVSGSGISWAVCKSAPRSRQITTLAPHLSVFLQAGCPSCRQTNSVKALKAIIINNNNR